jgi:recombination protein RecA
MTEAKEVQKPKRGPAKKGPVLSDAEQRRAKVAALTKAVIFKQTGQKPLMGSISTMAHVSTGSVLVDYLIGGSPAKDGKGPRCPGFPRRHITEVFGAESSGKTTLTLSAIAQCQSEGGIAMFIDFEHALDRGYAETLGVSFDENMLLFYQPDTMEEGFQMMSTGIMAGVDLIVVDSVAAMVPAKEFEKGVDEAAKVGGIAKPMAENLPKFAMWLQKFPRDKETKKPVADSKGTALVFINQTRALIQTGGGGGGGDNENSAGGKALKFFSYVRLKTTRIGSEYLERKDPFSGKTKRQPFGNHTQVKCVKSKCDAKQGHTIDIFIRYGYGIDNYYSIIQTACTLGLMKKEGGWMTYNNQRLQGRDKWRQFFIENPKAFEELTKNVTTAVLQTAETAVDDDDLTEEERMMAEFQKAQEDDDDVELEAAVIETVVEEAADSGGA